MNHVASEVNKSLSNVLALAIATSGGLGLIPGAPGTYGALLAVFCFFPLASQGLYIYLGVLALLSGLGVWSSSRAEEIFETSDDGRIVIDEVVGQLITLTPLVGLVGASQAGASGVLGAGRIEESTFILLTVTGFVTFRVLDIYKPGVIRWTERNISGGAGVMADDWVAGVFGAVALALLLAFAL